MVQWLRLGDEEVIEEHIQNKLDQVFKGTNASLMVTRSRISLSSAIWENIMREYEKDPRWADIFAELKSDPQKNLVKRGVKEFHLSKDCLELHDQERPNRVNI